MVTPIAVSNSKSLEKQVLTCVRRYFNILFSMKMGELEEARTLRQLEKERIDCHPHPKIFPY